MFKTIEERLETVEMELAELKSEIKTLIPRPNWIRAICGTFKDDPERDTERLRSFASAAVRLGRGRCV